MSGKHIDEADELKNWLKRRAVAEGFGKLGVTEPAALRASQDYLYNFLEAGFHGEMGWLAANREKRADPEFSGAMCAPSSCWVSTTLRP